MVVDIKQVVLHQLIKQDTETLETIFRNSPLPDNPAVGSMISELHRVYQNKNKAFAIFHPNSEFAKLMTAHLQHHLDFLPLTQKLTERLKAELIKYPFATGGVVVFCQYRYMATQYILIAVLNSCNSMFVNEQLEVDITNYLDIEHADIIARLDLTEWQTNAESKRYLSFLKGRVGRKISDFFMDFLGAEEGLDTKAQNRSLLQAVNDYCDDANLNQENRLNYQQQVYQYCQDKLLSGEDIAIKEIADELPPLAHTDFSQFTNNNGYALEQQFPPDRQTLKQLTRFSGSGGGLNISFDVQLIGKQINWDAETDTLIIKGTPPNLRDQLQRYKA